MNVHIKLVLRAGKVFYEVRKHVTFSLVSDGLLGFLKRLRCSLLNNIGPAKIEKGGGDGAGGGESNS